MGYYVRFLTPNISQVAQDEIAADVARDAPDAVLNFTHDETGWTSCEISRDGRLLSVLTRDIDTGDACLVAEEISEFIEELDGARPRNASQWLQGWLLGVKAIYAFQILGACRSAADWDAIGAFRSCLQDRLGGVTQADAEGFSNEDGHQIVWQFSDDVTGHWQMAVLTESGGWTHFEMDLGNISHRRAFWEGKVPPGCAS